MYSFTQRKQIGSAGPTVANCVEDSELSGSEMCNLLVMSAVFTWKYVVLVMPGVPRGVCDPLVMSAVSRGVCDLLVKSVLGCLLYSVGCVMY